MSVLEQLLEEMVMDCSACHDGVFYKENWKTGEVTELECTNCGGEGRTISWEGEQLIKLITRGELP